MNPYKNISYFCPFAPKVTKMGLNGSKEGNGVAFAFDAKDKILTAKEIGLIIYNDLGQSIKIPFSNNGRSGVVYGLAIDDEALLNGEVVYNFYADDEVIIDEYATSYQGNERFGLVGLNSQIKSVFTKDVYDWENSKKPHIPFEDTILYGLNVRSFTIDKTSGVKNKGTFEGVIEKLPYLRDLGVTSLVLMPSYEYDECHIIKAKDSLVKTIDEAKERSTDKADDVGKLNLWGFTKGYYFAPKNSYSANNNPIKSFKDLVKASHMSGIEIIMQFYFSPDMNSEMIPDILKYWKNEYQIDGFRISGFYIPHRLLINDSILKDTKLWFDYIPYDDINDATVIFEKNAAVNNGNFRNEIRRFLKSDENLINQFVSYQKSNPDKNAVINYLCDYDGFTLYDLYCYERKHNEYNGENNSDGTNENYSWNCGIEGESRKKAILNLRMTQVKNALSLLFLSQGTPYLFSGDEMLNTRGGNNNAYCLDNSLGYIKWKNNKTSSEIYEFTKMLIKLRQNNRILHMKEQMKNLDYLSLGAPDLSYHGIEAWRPELLYNSRMIGLYFNGDYAKENNKKCASFYIGINMHWENHRLAVPKLKKGLTYKKLLDTSNSNNTSRDNEIPVAARSIVVYEVVNE